MTTAEQVKLLLDAGSRVVLQRVRPDLTASGLAEDIGAVVVEDAMGAVAGPRVLDARGWRESRFADWDVRRPDLADAASPLVVLLDVSAGAALTRVAPHLASFAGGVQLPPDPAVRPARTDEELALGERALRIALAADAGTARELSGNLVAVDLLSGRLFTGRSDASPLDVAREYLDDGIVYVERVD